MSLLVNFIKSVIMCQFFSITITKNIMVVIKNGMMAALTLVGNGGNCLMRCFGVSNNYDASRSIIIGRLYLQMFFTGKYFFPSIFITKIIQQFSNGCIKLPDGTKPASFRFGM